MVENAVILNIDLSHRIVKKYKEAYLYVHDTLVHFNYEAYLVGGTVRDLLLNREIHDIDITTNATPSDIKKIFPKHINVGEKFGTIMVLYHSIPVEVTTFRSESLYRDGRHPKHVVWGKSAKEDAMRRDFTINGLYYDNLNKRILDYTGGLEDLQKKVLRTIGDPFNRFTEDGLRPVRACRFAATLGFEIEPETLSAISQTSSIIKNISIERLIDEIRKAQKSSNLVVFWKLLKETEIFTIFFHDLKVEDSYQEFLNILPSFSGKRMEFTFAALLYSKVIKNKNFRYQNNSIAVLLKKMKISSASIKEIKVIIENAPDKLFRIICCFHNRSEKSYKRYLSIVVKKYLTNITKHDLYLIIRFYGALGNIYLNHLVNKYNWSQYSLEVIKENLNLLKKIYIKIQLNNEPYKLEHLNINGNDLKKLRFTGRDIGNQLNKMLRQVIKDPSLNNKEKLINMIQNQSHA